MQGGGCGVKDKRQRSSLKIDNISSSGNCCSYLLTVIILCHTVRGGHQASQNLYKEGLGLIALANLLMVSFLWTHLISSIGRRGAWKQCDANRTDHNQLLNDLWKGREHIQTHLNAPWTIQWRWITLTGADPPSVSTTSQLFDFMLVMLWDVVEIGASVGELGDQL